jgi:hypothetical protein
MLLVMPFSILSIKTVNWKGKLKNCLSERSLTLQSKKLTSVSRRFVSSYWRLLNIEVCTKFNSLSSSSFHYSSTFPHVFIFKWYKRVHSFIFSVIRHAYLFIEMLAYLCEPCILPNSLLLYNCGWLLLIHLGCLFISLFAHFQSWLCCL